MGREEEAKSQTLPNAILCHHQNDSCIKRSRDESHWQVSLTARATKAASTNPNFSREGWDSRSGMKRKSFCLPAQCLRYRNAKPAYWFRPIEALLYVHRNRRLIRDGSPGRPPRLSHSSWALSALLLVNAVGVCM